MQRLTAEIIKEFEALVSEAERQCDRRKPEALNLISKAAEIAASTADARQLTMVGYLQAYYDCFIGNNYDKAIKELNPIIAALAKPDYDDIGYKLLLTLGNSYQLKGDLFSSQESYLKGLRCLQAKPHLTESEEISLASYYYNLSILLSSSELKIEAEDYLDKAVAVYSKLGKKFQLSNCYVAYAQLYERKKQFARAVEYLRLALELVEETSEPYSIALAKANLGLMLVKTNETEKSFVLLNEALSFFETGNMLFEFGMVKFELSQAYVFVGELNKGLDWTNQAEQIMLSLDNKKELSDIYRFKAHLLADSGNHTQAFAYQEKYIESLKFFFNNEKTNALTRAKKEFETELKEKESKLLREKNEEIQAYVQKLEISNNELKQFAHVASHDLREPLRMIIGYVSLIKKSMKEKVSEQESEFFAFVQDGAKRMDQLIQDLLRLAKVDANPVISRVKLKSIVDEIKLNLDTLIKEKNAVVQVDQLPTISADRAQTVQLFQNLIANGIKYNKNETPAIYFRHAIKKETLEIWVTDNGIGIPKHLHEEAFQIFKRLNNHSDTTGSGIGLAICKKIVESMGGNIRIEDPAEGGTSFCITFPVSLLLVE